MGLMRTIVRGLYKGARIARDVEVLSTGNPVKILKRATNKRLLKHVGGRIRV